MTKEEALNKIKELEKYVKELDKPVGYKDDEIFLLSIEEYERYMTNIPIINTWWWLRSPGYHSKGAAGVSSGGDLDVYGCYVLDADGAVRPALRYSNLKSKIVKSEIAKDRFIFNDFPFRIIDEDNEIAIAEVPIVFDKFDNESNDYENSDIRMRLLDWVKGAGE